MRDEDNEREDKDVSLIGEVKKSAFKGATIKLSEMMRQDGLIAEALDKQNRHNLGVVQTFITAIDDDKNYRQILKLARWRNARHREIYVKALNACRITGAWNAWRTLLDMITAEAAGEDGALMHEAAAALTHTSITTREEIERKQKYERGRGKSNNNILN